MYQEYNPAKYDPAKAHAYYESHKKLKGRTKTTTKTAVSKSGGSKLPAKPQIKLSPKAQKAQARVGRLRSKIKKLKGALSEAETELASRRTTARKTAKANSDGKTTVKERQSSQQYRDKHKQELAAKRKNNSSSSSSSSSTSSSKGVSGLSVQELGARIIKIKGLIREANRQLSDASKELGHLAHSAITSEPNINEHFAHFQSAERIPSK